MAVFGVILDYPLYTVRFILGMGASEATLFAREGAKVIATDVQVEPLKQVVKEIQENGSEAVALKHDVKSEEE